MVYYILVVCFQKAPYPAKQKAYQAKLTVETVAETTYVSQAPRTHTGFS